MLESVWMVITVSEPHVVVDNKGNPVSVILSIEKYREILRALEELEEIRAYDKAKKSGDKALAFEDVLKDIEKKNA